MNTQRAKWIWKFAIAMVIAALGAFNLPLSSADDAHKGEESEKLLKALPTSKMSLAGGIQQAAKSDGAPISAKFEFDDHGKLSLSVYTAEKGLAVVAEKNVLKELSGSPEQATWTPEAEVFKDSEHITRASEQLSLMSASHYSLLDIVNKAQTRAPGIAFSVAPGLLRDTPIALVELAIQSRTVKLVYDLKSGDLVGGTPPYGDVPGRRDAPLWEDRR
jgi:hypothetical protein